MNSSPDIYILGGSQTDFARNWQREGLELFDMFSESLQEAVANADIDPGQIEVGHVGNFVGELFAGKPHPLTGDRDGEFAVSLAGGHRLVFVPNDHQTPKTDTGHIDWPKVSSVKVIFAGDYHDS